MACGRTSSNLTNQIGRYQWSDGSVMMAVQHYDLRGRLVSESMARPLASGTALVPGLGDGVSESRSYDESGRVVEVCRYYQPGTWMWMNTGQGLA